jgi:hypothetical protein
MKIEKEQFEALAEKCFVELLKASTEKYDSEKAERTAALLLTAQMQLAFYIEDCDLRARHSKNEISRIEAVKYYEIKNAQLGKQTEMMLANAVAKDADVIAARRINAEAEADVKKLNYLMSTFKDSTYFFRSMSKREFGD